MGWELAPWQLASLRLETRQTCLVSPRQCGKSRSLSVLAVWWAFRKPGQLVLVVSAGDEAAGRLLRVMRQITAHPLLTGSVVDETAHRVILSNGSEIRSVPASERQVRGWTVDLLLVDECAFVAEELLLGAALPTTAARPEARTVLASTPWGTEGAFYTIAMAGLEEANPYVRTYRWALKDAHWITAEVVEMARRTLSPIRFASEFEGEWAPAEDAFFSAEDILACTADYPMARDGGGQAVAGLDWGRRADLHGVTIAGLLDDYGVNGRPVVVVAWCETSRRPYGQQVAEVEALAGGWALTIFSECNGVGAYPSEELAQRLPATRVVAVSSTQSSKEDSYGRVRALLAQRTLVLPRHEELLRQLGGVAATPTPSGGLRIAARVESLHDDLPDSLSMAVGGLPRELASVPVRGVPDGLEWAETAGGVRIPLPVRTMPAELSYLAVYGELVQCEGCARHYLSASASCPWCHRKGAHEAARSLAPAVVPAATGAGEHSTPLRVTPGSWAAAYYPENPRQCTRAGHVYAGAHGDNCPQCRGGLAGARGGPAAALGKIR